MKKEEEYTCPYCEADVTQLYFCNNDKCENYQVLGCTNPDIDAEGNPKCLYQYAYKVVCRICRKTAKIYNPDDNKDDESL